MHKLATLQLHVHLNLLACGIAATGNIYCSRNIWQFKICMAKITSYYEIIVSYTKVISGIIDLSWSYLVLTPIVSKHSTNDVIIIIII